MAKFIFKLFMIPILVNSSCFLSVAQTTTPQLVSSSKADTWVATDALDRSLTTGDKGSTIRKDKYVGIFYFLWHGAHGYDHHSGTNKDESTGEKLTGDTVSPYDITKLLKENPDNPNYGPIHAFHYWGEPLFGYYLPDDEWIIRKHAQMLSDAGVDVLILDVTNTSIYLPQVTKIVTTYRAMRREGISTPSISFIVNTAPAQTVNRLYDSIYKKGLFKDLWFYWKGKPLLLCPPEALNDTTRTFFNSRQSWAWSKGQKWFADGKDKWTWIDHTPQSYGWHEAKDKPEQISVSIAQHPMSNIGRSFHDGKEPDIKTPGKGLFFAEQWKRALEVDPEFVFVTGWNEWIAMRFNDGASTMFLGKKIAKGDTYFVDAYNEEYSRDAEPVNGSFADNYYYQMIDGIRRFKGVREVPVYKKNFKISIDGAFTDWQQVKAIYKDDKGDTYHRKHPGWGRIKEYVNTTGRNDITEAKVADDNKVVSFYVKTADRLTTSTDSNWMVLYINTHDSSTLNWQGFQFRVNQYRNKEKAVIEKNTGGNKWIAVGEANLSYAGNQIELNIPKVNLNIAAPQFTIDFKWADNIPNDGDPMHWLDKGDVAPNARFCYRYNRK
jgi:hypothetical protein